MKKDKNIERIERINSDREIILKSTKDNILKDNTLNNMAIDAYASNDETIDKIKQMISDLTIEAANAKTDEEIIQLRKRINYYISKLKKELKKRNISDEEYNNIYSNITSVRKGISSLVRYTKRQRNIDRMVELNGNFDSLTKDETLELRKLLNNERSYNRRNIRIINGEVPAKKVKQERTDIDVEETRKIVEARIDSTEEVVLDETSSKAPTLDVNVEEFNEIQKMETTQINETLEVTEEANMDTSKQEAEIKEDIDVEEIRKLVEARIDSTEEVGLEETSSEVSTLDVNVEEFNETQEIEPTQINETVELTEEDEKQDEIDVEEIANIIQREFEEKTNVPAVVYDSGDFELSHRDRSLGFTCENDIYNNFYSGAISVEDFLVDRLYKYSKTYHTRSLHKYDSNFIVNLINMFRNIPNYRINNRVLAYADEVCSRFYGGDDLRYFIEYGKKRNSLKYALMAIFNSKKLESDERELLEDSSKAAKWVLKYCNLEDSYLMKH